MSASTCGQQHILYIQHVHLSLRHNLWNGLTAIGNINRDSSFEHQTEILIWSVLSLVEAYSLSELSWRLANQDQKDLHLQEMLVAIHSSCCRFCFYSHLLALQHSHFCTLLLFGRQPLYFSLPMLSMVVLVTLNRPKMSGNLTALKQHSPPPSSSQK